MHESNRKAPQLAKQRGQASRNNQHTKAHKIEKEAEEALSQLESKLEESLSNRRASSTVLKRPPSATPPPTQTKICRQNAPARRMAILHYHHHHHHRSEPATMRRREQGLLGARNAQRAAAATPRRSSCSTTTTRRSLSTPLFHGAGAPAWPACSLTRCCVRTAPPSATQAPQPPRQNHQPSSSTPTS